MKTYDNKILRNIIEGFNREQHLTLRALTEKLAGMSFQLVTEQMYMLSKPILKYRMVLNGYKTVDMYLMYLPKDLEKISDWQAIHGDISGYEADCLALDKIPDYDNEVYTALEYEYKFQDIKVQFMYLEEEED